MMTAMQLSSENQEADRPTVLVVDDNPILRLTLAQEISEAGFKVREAATADEAETVLQTGAAIDLIVTDVEMPGSHDGLALAMFVRSHYPNTPVIVVSGKAPQTRVASVADAFFSKPYDVGSLIRRVSALLGHRAQSGAT
jgi:two-component system, response regulator PdtaR